MKYFIMKLPNNAKCPLKRKSVVMCISRRWDKDGDLWRQTVYSYKTSNK